MPTKDNFASIAWHSHTQERVLELLESSRSGLSSAQARERLLHFGRNTLPRTRPRSALHRIALQFHNPLLYAMLIAAALTAWFGDLLDTAVLLAAVLVNVLIGYVQESKAHAALSSLQRMLPQHAIALRDGHFHSVNADELVPGDIVRLDAGERIPADLRLLQSHALKTDESALTGESQPSDKHTQSVAHESAPVAERHCMAYSGTVAVHGQGLGVVVATGTRTELGEINELLAATQGAITPLTRQLQRFSARLASIIVAIGFGVFVYGTVIQSMPLTEALILVVALIASAIPEGMPATMTVAMALGVQRMARQNAVVRLLPAVETLGSVSVICSDKTGTLTQNAMTLEKVVCSGYAIDVTGAGYIPHGQLLCSRRAVHAYDHADLLAATRCALLCNDARAFERSGQWLHQGDPTEVALVVFAMKAGLDPDRERTLWTRTATQPFEPANQYMVTWHNDPCGYHWMFLKGAPERVLLLCQWQQDADGLLAALNPDYWHRQATDMAARGMRVLALAQKMLP
jgi:magnesium-transporting ATPase (P-type)